MRENFYHINPDLLVKYLLGEASSEEQTLTEQWINAGEANRKEFEHFRLIWEASRELAVQSDLDEEASWQKFRQRIQASDLPPIATVATMHSPAAGNPFIAQRMRRPLSLWRIAAALLLAVGAGWLLSRWLPVKQENAIHSYATVVKDTLPDGSVVTLNKNSLLTYPGRFKGDMRMVGLQGEAFFNVAPDKNKGFMIHVNDVYITVIGTSFNVRSVHGHTQVIVETGAVRVMRGSQTIELHAADRVDIAATDSIMKPEPQTDKLYNYYRSKTFVCDNTPLWKLAEVLEQAYDTHIVIASPAARNLKITTTFNEEPLDNILNIISTTLGVTHTKPDGQIVIQ
ncbi:MAG: FecR domain-containing protein [Bacteroidetes bacterium]|nr:FecR domain-containing protein [Bacteroidota bacterium]